MTWGSLEKLVSATCVFYVLEVQLKPIPADTSVKPRSVSVSGGEGEEINLFSVLNAVLLAHLGE